MQISRRDFMILQLKYLVYSRKNIRQQTYKNGFKLPRKF